MQQPRPRPNPTPEDVIQTIFWLWRHHQGDTERIMEALHQEYEHLPMGLDRETVYVLIDILAPVILAELNRQPGPAGPPSPPHLSLLTWFWSCCCPAWRPSYAQFDKEPR